MRAIALALFVSYGVSAQQNVTTIPRLVRISNTFHPADGPAPAAVEGVTLSIYREEREGAPLWQETQNVSIDSEGRYSVLLGATLNDGLPLELFASGEARWLGVRFNRPGEIEQMRTLLTSVPYALRASDAETLGGLPASAFLRDPSVSASPGVAAASSANLTPNAPKPRVTSGAAGYLGVFTNSTDLGNSIMYQNGYRIGLNTPVPADFLHVAFLDNSGAFTGLAVQNFGSGANAYSGMLFYDQNGNLGQFQGFNNSTHEYRINNIASNGTINFLIGSSSKFYVANSGNTGIGTSGPRYSLDVVGDINFSGILRFQGASLLKLAGGGTGPDTALGIGALANGIPGGNAAFGNGALAANYSGMFNTAIGNFALGANTSGANNTAVGYSAGGNSATACCNTATGAFALYENTGGTNNTADGDGALEYNLTGNGNTAVGADALFASSGSGNTAVGQSALSFLTSGSNNVAVGNYAAGNVSSGSNNIHIGNTGAFADNDTIRIGTPGTQTSFYVAGVNGVTTTNSAVPVLIDTTTGQLGVTSSSRRYKEDIQDMGDASRALMQLRPVTFRYQKPFADGSKPIQYGLIAEEVAEVYPDLVARSADGQVETVKYQVLDSMLLNEVQHQQTEIQRQQARIEELERWLNELKAAVSSQGR